MFGVSPLVVLFIVWGAVTAVLAALLIWRAIIGLREVDQVHLDPAEATQEAAERQLITRVERVESYAKGFGWASAALLAVIAGVWIYQGLNAFRNPPMP